MRKLILLVLVVAVLAALPKMLDAKDPLAKVSDFLGLGIPRKTDAMVLAIKDGETIRVRVLKTGVEVDVRIVGIDAPGARQKCGGPAARDSLRAALPVGATVRLESDPRRMDRDTDDVFLRYVTAAGTDIGLEQLRAGVAKTAGNEDDAFERFDVYRRAQRKARKQDLGLWAACWR